LKIIAEVGSNVISATDCFYSIEAAKLCGADAVKFQWFESREMYGFDGYCEPFFPKSLLLELADKCEEIGIEFMVTVFSPETLEMIAPRLKTIKIASSDMEYLPLISAAMATGKEIYLSTGGHSAHEIQRVLDYIDGYEKLVLFYCNAEYPTYSLDFRNLLKEPFCDYKTGLSDHSKEVFLTALAAPMFGVDVIEKHVNFCGHKHTPDAPHSLSLKDFKRFCSAVRGELDCQLLVEGEYPMRSLHNRRLVALTEIKAGDQFIFGKNFGMHRGRKECIEALNPIKYNLLSKSSRSYSAGDIIIRAELWQQPIIGYSQQR